MAYKLILSQNFDIRPMTIGGSLDWEKINGVQARLDLRREQFTPILANFLDRESILVELAAIERNEQKIKGLLTMAPCRLAVRPEGEVINEAVLINKNIVKPSAFFNDFVAVPDQPTPEIKLSPVLQPQDTRPPVASDKNTHRDRASWWLIFLLVGLLAANFFLGRGAVDKLTENRKVGLYSSIIKNTTDFLFAGDLSFLSLFNDFVRDYNVFLKFLGASRPQKYLLIFQNNSEMRATGGFIGSYGIIDLDRGKIKNLFFDDVYNIDGQLQEKIVPPAPILKVADFWSMHDANWYADFPTSARKVAWFYEKTGGPTVDGVISLTPTVVENILKIIGPINLPEYNLTITSDNFVEQLQYKVEKDFDKNENQPKKILVAFANKFFDRLKHTSNGEWPKLLEALDHSLKEKHILLFFKDDNLERYVLNRRWGGQIMEAEQDYLSVINSNLGGAKSDRLMEEKVEHWAEISADGSVIDTVRISRYHRGGKTEYEWWNKPNIDYLRVYVPRDAQLINSPSDVEVLEETGRTVFAKWVTTNPGETSVIEYKYSLPFSVRQKYSLYVQKQSGSLGSQFVGLVKTNDKELKNEDMLTEDRSYNFSL